MAPSWNKSMQTEAHGDLKDLAINVNHGCLSPWQSADLPEPLPFSLGNIVRTNGSGNILMA